jgi:hypothetical protein
VGDPTDHSRLGWLAVLGAWLGLWTPPRDAVVPPVPWRRIAALGAALVVALAATALLVLPDVSNNREAARERAERAATERHAAFLRSVDREQRPRHGRAQADPGSAATVRGAGAAARDRDAAAGERVAVRTALLDAARARIGADSRTRTSKRVRGVVCEPFPRRLDAIPPARDLARTAAEYDCVAVTARLPERQGIIGIQFRLVARFDRGTFAWCRVIPLGDKDRLSHPLPAACRLGRR